MSDNLLSRDELVRYFRTEEYADEIADIISNFPPAEHITTPAQSVKVPDGYVLVPREPSQQIIDRMTASISVGDVPTDDDPPDRDYDYDMRKAYRAALSLAAQPPAAPVEAPDFETALRRALDDLTVEDGKCNWAEVANILPRMRGELRAYTPPQRSSAATAIAALAKRFWSIHPKEIQDLGITREQFYEREMRALFATLVPDEPQGVRMLDWQETFTDRGDGSKDLTGWEAETYFGTWYSVEQYFASDSYAWHVKHDFDVVADCDDPEQAKEAAQADFEKRVASALSRPHSRTGEA